MLYEDGAAIRTIEREYYESGTPIEEVAKTLESGREIELLFRTDIEGCYTASLCCFSRLAEDQIPWIYRNPARPDLNFPLRNAGVRVLVR